MTLDISGSNGAAIEESISEKPSLKKTVRFEPFGVKELARVKLFGDWSIKMRVTYDVLEVNVEKHPYMLL